jgi:hypothetical protein
MVNRRRLIGNDIVSGGGNIKPYRAPKQRAIRQSELLQAHRQRMIAYTAKPPALPLPNPIKKNIPDTPGFNQFAYSFLLISVMSAVAVATTYINWMFLLYGILAVIMRFPSRIIFVSALICFVIVIMSSVVSKNSLANTFAVMAFYFMVIGLIRAILELHNPDLGSIKS